MKKTLNYRDRKSIFDYFNISILFVLAAICLYPCYLVLVLSLNDPVDALRGNLFFFVRKFSFENYIFFFKDPALFRAFSISVARTAIGALTSVFFTACFAYGVSKKDLFARKFIITFMLITMYINGGLIPYFLLIKKYLTKLSKFLIKEA